MFFRLISTSETGVVTTLRKFTRTVGPGLRFKLPFVQDIDVISNRLCVDFFDINIKTKDNVFTQLYIDVQYKVLPEDSATAHFSMEKPKDQLTSFIETAVLAKASQMTLDQLFESQSAICADVTANLQGKLKVYGYTIQNTLVTSIKPPENVVKAMNDINASERTKAAARNTADAEYITAIRKAEADRDRKRLQGEGTAQQRAAIIEGYGNGVTQLAEQWGVSAHDIARFVLELQNLDVRMALSNSPNAKVILMDDAGKQSHLAKQIVKANEISSHAPN